MLLGMSPEIIMLWIIENITPIHDKKEFPRIVPPESIWMPALTVLVLILQNYKKLLYFHIKMYNLFKRRLF